MMLHVKMTLRRINRRNVERERLTLCLEYQESDEQAKRNKLKVLIEIQVEITPLNDLYNNEW